VKHRVPKLLFVASVALLVALAPAVSIAARFKIKATADDTWSPDFQHITRNNVIVWRNPDDRFHDLTSYGRNWSMEHGLPPGRSTSRRFKKVGVYKFRCRIHSALKSGQCDGMCGVVHVTR
jgi:plastocyanin